MSAAIAIISTAWAISGSYLGANGVWPPAAAQQPNAFVDVDPVKLVEPGSNTPFGIQIGPAEISLKNSFLRIRGLPAAAALSEGHAIGPGTWAVPLKSLPTLHILLPSGLQGRWNVTIGLVNMDGAVLTEAKTALVVASTQAIVAPQGNQEDHKANIASTASIAPPPPASPEYERALSLHTKGQEQLKRGDVQTARLYFQRAAEAGLAQSALALGATYDPGELAKLQVIGLRPDIASARRWYEKAQELGAAEAADRLGRLPRQ